MTRSRKIAEQRDKEQHRSQSRTDHAVGKPQRPRPARRGAGDHPKPARTPDRHSEVAAPTTAAAPSSAHGRSESVSAGNDKLADLSAVVLMVLSGLAMVLFFVALAIGPSM